jgi:cytochrome P450
VDLQLDVATANQGDVRDPYTGYAKARRNGPVATVEHYGVKVVMVYSYAEAEAVLRDGEAYSSRINGRWMRPFLGKTILEMDGIEHNRYRGLIAHAFRPKAVRGWEESLLRPTVHELLDRLAPRGRAELVREFAWQLPPLIIAKMVGVPQTDYAMWQRRAIELESTAVDWNRAITASEELRKYFAPMVEARRKEPRDDLISDLVTAEIDGHKLEDDLIHSFLRLLVPAGAGTTYRLIGSLLFGLLSDPEQLEAVRADRSLVPGAVEESLRWESPVQFAAREATRDAELAGVPIPAGTAVTLALGSANHDEARWEQPDAFDARREVQSHVAFGDGGHYCLGAHLARLEAVVSLDAILDRLGELHLDPGAEDPHMVGFAFRSPTAVPVAFAAA